MIIRRTRTLLAGTALATILASSGSVVAAHAATTSAHAPATAARAIYLPRPSGPDPVGTVLVHLVDHNRTDPLAPGRQPRELMTQIWYPAHDVAQYPVAPYMPPLEAARHVADLPGIPVDTNFSTPAHARLDAPALPSWRGRPVVLFSPGLCSNRTDATAIAEQLASEGMVVAATASTHEADEVEFPGGRLVTENPAYCNPQTADLAKLQGVRVADTRFVLAQLARIDAGADPDADHHPLPAGLAHSLDLRRVGMLGHSLGGSTAAEAMREDRQIVAGVDLDGGFTGPVATAGLNRPFLVFGAGDHQPAGPACADATSICDASWTTFMSASTGWQRWLLLRQAGHYRFIDDGANIRAWGLEKIKQSSPVLWREDFGDIPDHRSLLVVRAYVTAFFARFLDGSRAKLLDGPSRDYPEVAFPAPA